ncbi:hypothetical protein [Muricauda sp. MAR_2010_75]|nr:hypothetical protein [Muricauda sp. MAR_2010_75]
MLKEKNELENKDLLIDRSDEVNQILGKPPNWIIKWGITIVFIVLMFLIILINLISYKETINSPVELNISKSISYLRKKTNEKIEHILVKNGQFVKEGEILAVMENNANNKDIELIQNKLNSILDSGFLNHYSVQTQFPLNVRLGGMNTPYRDFVSKYQQYLEASFMSPKKTLINERIKRSRTRLAFLKNKRLIIEEEKTQVAKSYYLEQKKSLITNHGRIHEFEQALTKYLERKNRTDNIKDSISLLEMEIDFMNDFILPETTPTFLPKKGLYSSLFELKSKIEEWESKYTVKSPISGKVLYSYPQAVFNDQSINDTIFVIIPNELKSLEAQLRAKSNHLKEVKENSLILLKFQQHPFKHLDEVRAKISSIEKYTHNEETNCKLSFDSNVVALMFDEKFDLKENIVGEGTIVIRETNLWDNLFSQIFESVNKLPED